MFDEQWEEEELSGLVDRFQAASRKVGALRVILVISVLALVVTFLLLALMVLGII